MRELAAVGLPAGVASYRIIPKEELRDPEKAEGWYVSAGVEGVVAMRLVSSDKQQTWDSNRRMRAVHVVLQHAVGLLRLRVDLPSTRSARAPPASTPTVVIEDHRLL